MTIDELNKLAWDNAEMPDDLIFSEQCYFIAIRALMNDYKQGAMSKQQLLLERNKIAQRYKEAEMQGHWLASWDFRRRLYNRHWEAMPDHNCKQCIKTRDILTGLRTD